MKGRKESRMNGKTINFAGWSARLATLALALTSLSCVALSDKCADECSCKWKNGKRTVECVNRGLTGIPEWIDPETQVLDASGNDIGTLPRSIFVRVRLTNIQRLYLRECRIDRIDEQALAGLTNLVELDLSDNHLSAVPSASFAGTVFLRDLVLAYNPLGRIRGNDFRHTPHLVKLDLSHARLEEIDAKGFRGLESLENLKLNDNRLTTLLPGTFAPLGKLTGIELHENPWNCDCHLRETKMWLVNHNLPSLVAPVCREPGQLANKAFSKLEINDFACRPVMMIASRYAEATIGENASIVCRVSAVPPAKIKWYWNGRLLANHSAFSSYQKILVYEEGQFRKRSTLVLTNAQEADSSEFYCVAENNAGSVEANFTLHVSLRTAGMSTLGSGQIAGISAALVVLILIILLVILVLFVRLRRMPLKEVKATGKTSSSSSSSKTAGTTGASSSSMEVLPEDGLAGRLPLVTSSSSNPPSGASTIARQKREETTDGHCPSFEATIAASSSSLGTSTVRTPSVSYVQRPQPDSQMECRDFLPVVERYDQREIGSSVGLMTGSPSMSTSGCFGTAAGSTLMPIGNPDLIRDTRHHGSQDDPTVFLGEYSRVDLDETNGKILYAGGCLWESRDGCRTGSLSTVARYPSKETLQAIGEQFPAGAKQMRVWQKGVPVLPPVSALKRVLGSTRSSPDEGYQEGTGTDV